VIFCRIDVKSCLVDVYFCLIFASIPWIVIFSSSTFVIRVLFWFKVERLLESRSISCEAEAIDFERIRRLNCFMFSWTAVKDYEWCAKSCFEMAKVKSEDCAGKAFTRCVYSTWSEGTNTEKLQSLYFSFNMLIRKTLIVILRVWSSVFFPTTPFLLCVLQVVLHPLCFPKQCSDCSVQLFRYVRNLCLSLTKAIFSLRRNVVDVFAEQVSQLKALLPYKSSSKWSSPEASAF